VPYRVSTEIAKSRLTSFMRSLGSCVHRVGHTVPFSLRHVCVFALTFVVHIINSGDLMPRFPRDPPPSDVHWRHYDLLLVCSHYESVWNETCFLKTHMIGTPAQVRIRIWDPHLGPNFGSDTKVRFVHTRKIVDHQSQSRSDGEPAGKL
jgi:hypothetical protein